MAGADVTETSVKGEHRGNVILDVMAAQRIILFCSDFHIFLNCEETHIREMHCS